jgi:hypothetical protein
MWSLETICARNQQLAQAYVEATPVRARLVRRLDSLALVNADEKARILALFDGAAQTTRSELSESSIGELLMRASVLRNGT